MSLSRTGLAALAVGGSILLSGGFASSSEPPSPASHHAPVDAHAPDAYCTTREVAGRTRTHCTTATVSR